MSEPRLLKLSLDLHACRTRQERLREAMREEGIATALLLDRRHVHYLTGYWHYSSNTRVAVVVPLSGPVTLVAPGFQHETAADICRCYEANRLSTLVDDQFGALWTVVEPLLSGWISCDERIGPVHDLLPILYRLRRTKDADEVAMLRQAITCCDTAYTRAKELLQPGVSEMHLYAELLAAASEAAGEPIGEFGNDFQSGTPGGLPRLRVIELGEMAIYDLTAIYRGYACDLCRSFVVGGQPSDAQQTAFHLIEDAFALIEATVKPGASCRELYHQVFALLNGKHGWSFPHHLGHGIGLNPHEGPRLNPNWDDVFQPGDTFTAEPGLYGADLRGGIRIEHNYLVTETGVERLSPFPIAMA